MSKNLFEYALLRVVPRVERGELLNVGVIVYCQAADFLDCAIDVDEPRLLSLDPLVDVNGVRSALQAHTEVCRGSDAAGEAGKQSLGERFRWMTAPRSTVVQPGPVHSGWTDDPGAEVERLMDRLVRLENPP